MSDKNTAAPVQLELTKEEFDKLIQVLQFSYNTLPSSRGASIDVQTVLQIIQELNPILSPKPKPETAVTEATPELTK